MIYVYTCDNKDCDNFEIEIEINKPISEFSRSEFCDVCKKEMIRVFKPVGVKTSDGFKGS